MNHDFTVGKKSNICLKKNSRQKVSAENKSALELPRAGGPVWVLPITQPHEGGCGGAETGEHFTQMIF